MICSYNKDRIPNLRGSQDEPNLHDPQDERSFDRTKQNLFGGLGGTPVELFFSATKSR